DVDSLKAGTHYFYRFWYKGEYSPLGKFRTLPASLEKPLQIAVVSCNNYEDGYFSSFRHIAENRDIDYVFHLGDYIYEYGTGEYANSDFIKKSNRINDPLHEIVSLEDYRKRFAQYRSDKDLQQAHQEKAFFCIWDDHELANNAFVEGAKNHQPDEGDWYSRKQAALRAYFEWMPVRAGSVKEMIRKVSLGTDCNFYFLEERLDGRTKQFTLSDDEFYDEERKLISDEQMLWLKNNLEDQSVRWQILINQVMFTGYRLKEIKTNSEIDWWTGYPYQRKELMDIFGTMKNPPVILTGDHHQAHVLELYADEKTENGKILAWEFLTPSITSKNDDRLSLEEVERKSKELYQHNPHLIYNNTNAHGFFIFKIKPESIEVDYRFNSNILQSDGYEVQGPKFKIDSQNQFTKNV